MNAHAAAGEAHALARLRVTGGVRLHFQHGARGTICQRVAEADGYRARFPAHGHGCEAVLLNTGGGVAGGDHVTLSARLDAGAAACITSVAAERIYRSTGLPARLDVQLTLADAAELGWLPEETILSSGAGLRRRIEADLTATSRLTLVDMLVLGRKASGETIRSGEIADDWFIRRDGRLIQREALRLTGDIAARLEQPAIAGGHHIIGTLLHVAPDATDLLPVLRQALAAADGISFAISAWNGKIVLRALATQTAALHRLMSRAAGLTLRQALPRQWANR